MSNRVCLVALLLVCQGDQNVFSTGRWLVNQNGSDSVYCGNWTMPCRTVRYAVKKSQDGDHIYIDHANGRPYTECENVTQSIELNKTISFYGINGKPTIKCKRSHKLFVINNSDSKTPKITFANLAILSAFTAIECIQGSFEVVFDSIIFGDNVFGIHGRASTQCSIKVHNTTFEKKSAWAIWLRCFKLTAHLTSSKFKQNAVLLRTVYHNLTRNEQKVEVFVRNSVFDGEFEFINANLLSISAYAVFLNVTIWDTAFVNYLGITSQKNYAFSPFLLNDHNWHRREVTFISLRKIRVENCLNERPSIYLGTVFSKHTAFTLQVLDSIFKNNSGAIRIKTFTRPKLPKPTVILQNNTFDGNYVGPNTKHAASAMFLRQGDYRVTSCRFLDNKAGESPFFAVVTVSENAHVRFRNCYFENRQTVSSAAQFYGNGLSNVYFKGKNTFNIIALNTGQPVFLRIPVIDARAVVAWNRDFKILCPQGYVVNWQKECKIRRTEGVFYCTYVYITCEQCPAKTYALERGEFSNNARNNIHCTQCPRGGNCERGVITARPNFWGYKINKEIKFAQCPPGYCCDSKDCVNYNSCQGNRTGTLCGRCPRGMSDSLFSSSCAANVNCSGYAFIVGAAVILCLYLAFFLYHEEIVAIVRKSFFGIFNTKWRRKTSGRKRKGSSGLLKVIFYYYQVARLLRSTVGPPKGNQIVGKVEDAIARVVNMVLVDISSFSCPFQNLTPVQKVVTLHSVGYSLLGLLGVLYLVTVGLLRIFKHKRGDKREEMKYIPLLPMNETSERRSKPFKARIASAFTYISLLMYASSTQLCLSLLHCVSIDESLVLFLDGNIKCYQPFQYFLVAYVVSSVLPFCLVPVLGAYLLTNRRISVAQFCIACIFPLPFCCFWSYLLFRECRLHKRSRNGASMDSYKLAHGNHEDCCRCQGKCIGQRQSEEPFEGNIQTQCLGHDQVNDQFDQSSKLDEGEDNPQREYDGQSKENGQGREDYRGHHRGHASSKKNGRPENRSRNENPNHPQTVQNIRQQTCVQDRCRTETHENEDGQSPGENSHNRSNEESDAPGTSGDTDGQHKSGQNTTSQMNCCHAWNRGNRHYASCSCSNDSEETSQEATLSEIEPTSENNQGSAENEEQHSRKAILRVLLGPFRNHKAFLCFPDSVLPWEGYLIFRRLALILALTFIYDRRLKMMIALGLCVAILASHAYFKPFVRAFDNTIEAISLSILTVLCGSTLVKILYNGENLSSSSSSSDLLHIFNMVENLVVVLPLAVLVLIAILSVLSRLWLMFRNFLQSCQRW